MNITLPEEVTKCPEKKDKKKYDVMGFLNMFDYKRLLDAIRKASNITRLSTAFGFSSKTIMVRFIESNKLSQNNLNKIAGTLGYSLKIVPIRLKNDEIKETLDKREKQFFDSLEMYISDMNADEKAKKINPDVNLDDLLNFNDIFIKE
jgi:hypothetical protein